MMPALGGPSSTIRHSSSVKSAFPVMPPFLSLVVQPPQAKSHRIESLDPPPSMPQINGQPAYPPVRTAEPAGASEAWAFCADGGESVEPRGFARAHPCATTEKPGGLLRAG